jgi:hypothetical protein
MVNKVGRTGRVCMSVLPTKDVALAARWTGGVCR